MSLATVSGVEEEKSDLRNTISFKNPSNKTLNLSYSYQKSTSLELTVFDIQGRKVYDLRKGSLTGSGNITINLDHLSEGIYLLRITEGSASRFEKLVLLK